MIEFAVRSPKAPVRYGTEADSALTPDQLARAIFMVCVGAYFLHALYAVITHRHLYADAAWFLVRMVSEGKVTNFYNDFAKEFYYSRFVAYGFTQWPTVIAAKLGISDWRVLSWIFGLTYFSHKLISLVLSYRLLPQGQKIAFIFPALGLFAGSINSEVYIVTETHIAVSFFWPMLIALAQVQPQGRRYFIGCAIAALFAAFSYESMAFLAPIMLAVVGVRCWRAEPHARKYWLVLACFVCVPIIINWMAILFPRDPANKSAFTDGIKLLLQSSVDGLAALHIGPVVSVLASAVVGVLLLVPGVRAKYGQLAIVVALVILVIAPPLHFILYADHVDFAHAMTDRGFSGLVMQAGLAAMYLFAWWGGFSILRSNAGYMLSLIGALAIGQVSWQLLASNSWKLAVTKAETTLASGRGLIPCTEQALGGPEAYVARANGILCRWWALPTSVLLAPEGNAKALFSSIDSFHPFDPRNRATFPTMQYAPVDFSGYFESLEHDRDLDEGGSVGFQAGAPGTPMLGAGFSQPEGWATWTDGQQASMRICRGPRSMAMPVVLTFDVTPFVNDMRPRLAADVFVNGAPAGRWEFQRGEQGVKRSVPLGAVAASDRCQDISFRFDDSRPGTQIGAGSDPRRLGVAFLRVAMEKVSQ